MPALLLSLCCLILLSVPVCGQVLTNPAETKYQSSAFTVQPAQQQVLLTGFTRALATVDIIPEIAGQCLEITSDIGETIGEKGVFAVIDSTLLRLDLKTNTISRQQVQRKLRFEEQQVKRYQQLHTSKSSSRVQLDDQELQLDLSRIKLNQLQVEGERLKELLARHEVKAPPGWRIMKRHVEPGQWVPGGKILAKAGDYRALIVPLAVTPTELRSLQQQKTIPLQLPVDNLNGHGSLYRISPGFDPITRKIKVEVLIDQDTYDKLSLKQGGIRVKIPVQIPDPMHGFLVPAKGVVERYEENWLIRQNGQQVQIIVLGPATIPGDGGEWLHITSPAISPGDVFQLPPVP